MTVLFFLSIILSIIGTTVSFLAANFSLYTVSHKLRAEKRLHAVLAEDREELLRYLENGSVAELSRDELEKVLTHLKEHFLVRLQTDYRRSIAQSLNQPSDRGRQNYVRKLLAETARYAS
jgi:hypothetical protein